MAAFIAAWTALPCYDPGRPFGAWLCNIAINKARDRSRRARVRHLKVAERMGIPKAKVDAIAHDRFDDPLFTERERALLAFTRQVVKDVRVDGPTFNAVAAFYTPRQMVETILVISNYMMILRVSEVAELPNDGNVGADFWKDRPAK